MTEKLVSYDPAVLSFWIVVVPNYWGKGRTREEAWKNARKSAHVRANKKFKDFYVYRVHETARIGGDMGNLKYHGKHGYALVEGMDNGVPEKEFSVAPDPDYADMTGEEVKVALGLDPDWTFDSALKEAK